MSQILKLGTRFIIPFYIEDMLEIAESQGNMGLYGLFLGIYYKRNILYFSLFSLLLSYLFAYKYLLFLSLILTIFSVYSFLSYVFDWYQILSKY